MALLAGTLYDPATAASKSCASLLAMTALDTTNLRLTFTAPTSGNVLVRIGGTLSKGTTASGILFGVLDGATIRGRAAPISGRNGINSASSQLAVESLFVVTGLTGGTSYTWDAAYDVEFVSTSDDLWYGGPNDTTVNNAWGGFRYEIWDTANLLAGTLYDPSVAVAQVTTAAKALTALDTTNLRLTFTPTASGKVLVRLRGMIDGATGVPQILLGVLSGSSVIGRVCPSGGIVDLAGALATTHNVFDAQFVVTGLSGSQTWDAAYGVESTAASTALRYGGPNDTTQDNAYGGFAYEVWAC